MLYSCVTGKLVNVLSFSIKYSKNCNLQGQSVGMCHSNLNFYIVLVCTAKRICQRKSIKARTSTFVLYDSTMEREDWDLLQLTDVCVLYLISHASEIRSSFNTSYLTDSYIVFTLKMKSVSKNTIVGLKVV